MMLIKMRLVHIPVVKNQNPTQITRRLNRHYHRALGQLQLLRLLIPLPVILKVIPELTPKGNTQQDITTANILNHLSLKVLTLPIKIIIRIGTPINRAVIIIIRPDGGVIIPIIKTWCK